MDFDEDPDYLDLDDILAQAQSVKCKFLLTIPNLDFLFSDGSEAEQGENILLPFWLAKTLYTYSMIDIEIPKHYNSNFRETLEAEPDVVNLHKSGPYYYQFGKLLIGLRREKGNQLAKFTEEGQRNKYRREEGETLADRRPIAESLISAFNRRRSKLLEYSLNLSADDKHHEYSQFGSRLDNLEKRLFKLGRQQVEDMRKWMTHNKELLRNNLIAARLSKRRKLEASQSSATQ